MTLGPAAERRLIAARGLLMSRGLTAAHGLTAIIGASTAALLVAGCAGVDVSADAPADELLPTAEGITSYPLTLESPFGESVLEERPERIAVIGGGGELASALAIGIEPVIAGNAELAWLEPYAAELEGAETIEPWADSFAYETVLAAQPDLIVALTYSGIQDDYDRLSDIAPVLAPSDADSITRAADWQAMTEAIGEAVDLLSDAQQVVADTDAHVEAVAARNTEFAGHSLGVLVNRGQEYGIELVNTAGSPAEELLTGLGFEPHPHASDVHDVLSLENLSLAEADALLVHLHGGTGPADEAAAWLEGSAVYQRLGAVESDQVVSTNADAEGGPDLPWALSWPDALSIRWTADSLETALEGTFAK